MRAELDGCRVSRLAERRDPRLQRPSSIALDAAEALEMGFVTAVHEDAAGVLEAAVDLARQIAANSPLAVQGSKAVLNASRQQRVREDLDRVALWNAAFLYSDDLAEAMQAFLEKRPPEYKGR